MKKSRKRKKKVVFYKNKRILMYSLLGLFLFLGIGYSVLNTELGIFGDGEGDRHYDRLCK